jgi:hypothetical protein
MGHSQGDLIPAERVRYRAHPSRRSNIESQWVNRTICGGILGYGDTLAAGTEGTNKRFVAIGAPMVFHRNVQVAKTSGSFAARCRQYVAGV